jgi:type I restriction enzyme S subunit
MHVKSDGVSQSNINARKLAAYVLPCPPLDEQHEIVRRVQTLFAVANSIERRVQVATREAEFLAQSILARAFRGELVATEADLARAEGRDYETAEQLLVRIREELARRTPEKKQRRKAAKGRKDTVKKLGRDSVADAIASMPEDVFSFDDLRKELPGDYDTLRNFLFDLLADASSGLKQVFDEQAQAMRLRRGSKA